MKYRRDIDGLRALAVVPVVLFHAHLAALPGGYVGVDIFFVISGFLITGILHREISDGTFTFADFYERRARRILPALFAVLATTLLIAALIMLPEDFEDATTSAAAAIFSVANIVFWLDSGYFSGPAEAKPLLHTWSLGVEEQFYIFWPMILIVLARVSRPSLPLALIIITAISFAISEWQVRHAPDAAFYLLPSRAWQLAVGGILAIGMIAAPLSARTATIAATAGLAAIVVAILTFTPRTPFPGFAAALPTLGATLIIWSGTGQTTWVARLLALRPMVWIGLISYALYLWHWPVFVLAKYVNREPMSGTAYLLLITLAVALAALTYRFIEQPFRRRDGAFPLTRLLQTLGGGTVALIAVAAWSYTTSGVPERLPEKARQLAAAEASYGIFDEQCLNRGLDRITAGDLCHLGERKLSGSKSAPTFLLWGDSHAEAMAPAFAALARDHGVTGLYAARDACPPLVGATQWPTTRNSKCPPFQQAMLKQARMPVIRDVILVARWNLYHGGWPKSGIESAASEEFLIHDSDTQTAALAENGRVLARTLRSTIAMLRANNKRVWIVTQVPYVGYRVPTELALAAFSPIPRHRARPIRAVHLERAEPVAQLLREIAEDPGVFILDPSQQFCTGQTCRIENDGIPLYRDDDHLSREGAAFILPTLAPLIAALKQG